jgi:hypothetical protein
VLGRLDSRRALRDEICLDTALAADAIDRLAGSGRARPAAHGERMISLLVMRRQDPHDFALFA